MSAAALEYCARPRATLPLPQGMPARAVEQVSTLADLSHFFGLQMFQTHAALCHPEIEAGDCIEVDFDRREIRHDGLYMITLRHSDGSSWHGARRFALRPAPAGGSELWGFDICSEAWSPLSTSIQSRIVIFGEVREVYKPISKLRRST